jgi:hypothetical protein
LRIKIIQEGTPSYIATALNQLVKGAKLALHQVTLLSTENERLWAANVKKKRKRNSKRYISKSLNQTVQKGQNILSGRQKLVA